MIDVAETIAQLSHARLLLREIACESPFDKCSEQPHCVFCGAEENYVQRGGAPDLDPNYHERECVWRKAVEFSRAHPRADS